MDPIVSVLIVAGVAVLLAVLCLVAFIKSRNQREEAELAPRVQARVVDTQPVPSQPTDPTPSAEPEPAPEPMRRFQVVSSKEIKQCLFVILDWPGLDTNRRLARLLKEYNAHYDAKLGVYTIRDQLAGYKLTIANSSPPGTLPPIHDGDDQPTVAGVSILIHFISKRSVARNPETLIKITQSIADIGGQILDAERNAVSEEEFEALRQQAQRMVR